MAYFSSQQSGQEGEWYITIHGHFYQPPRENPWLNYVERQESAYPFHDWNERITYECYMPNTASRVLSPEGLIVDIVNNFEYINFNIGPTLFEYLEKHFSKVYQRIIDADKRSVERFNGHGNAIAQVYNHIIMPLADDRDNRTQIEWGVYDFERRFGRKPESIWLAETAINYRVLRHLIEYGFKYIILSPYQAEKVRPIKAADEDSEENDWIDVSAGTIDPRQPYRHFWINDDGTQDRSRYIDIFFYDPHLAQKVSFAHLLRSADELYNAFLAAVDQSRAEPQLIHYATDGENYGHHEPFGDMALAYFVKYKLRNSPFKLVNYGAYLENNPPTWEVLIKAGPNGEGTAWSCAHGVGRWYRDCGCHTGGREGWNQKWRTPLRQAFDYLRDEMRTVYEERGHALFKDIWRARDEYVEVIDDRSRLNHFLKKHLKKDFPPEKKMEAVKLLEGQRYAMYMYTSCGWFFSDVSGIETLQNMKYADMAYYHYRDFFYKDVFAEVLKKLAEAKSNIPEMRDGAYLYERFAASARMTIRRVLALFLIKRLISETPLPKEFYDYKIDLKKWKRFEDGERQVFLGFIVGRWNVFGDLPCCKEYRFMVIKESLADLYVYLDEAVYEAEKAQFLKYVEGEVVPDFEQVRKSFRDGFIGLRDLIYEERDAISDYLLDKHLNSLKADIDALFTKYEQLVHIYDAMDLKPPKVLLDVAQSALANRIMQKIDNLISQYEYTNQMLGAKEILRLVNIVKSLQLHIDEAKIAKRVSEFLKNRIDDIIVHRKFELIDPIYSLLKIIYRFEFKLELRDIQDSYYEFLHKIYKDIDDFEILGKLLTLARYIGIKAESIEQYYKDHRG